MKRAAIVLTTGLRGFGRRAVHWFARGAARRTAWSAYLACLLLLSANDAWFKASGWLPTWFTGKLSDAAGLVVAPLTLVLLFGRRSPWARALAFSSVTLVFAAINLSDTCSGLWVALLAKFGLAWVLWPDPTDLLALGVLPYAWRFSSALVPTRPLDRSRLLALPAAGACLASGTAFSPNATEGHAFVYNDTQRLISLDVAYVPWVECRDLDEFGDGLLQRSDFDSRDLIALAPGAAQTLSRRTCGCDLFRVTAGGRSIVLRVPQDSVRLDRHPTEHQLRLRKERMLVIGNDFSFRVGSRLRVVADLETAESTSCGSEPQAMAFSVPWSTAPRGFTVRSNMELLEVEPVAGNCFEVVVQATSTTVVGQGGAGGAGGEGGHAGAAGGAGAPEESLLEQMFLCAPMELFPFAAGDRVTIRLENAPSSANGEGGTGARPGLTGPRGIHTLTLEDAARGFAMRLGGPEPGETLPGYSWAAGTCGPVRGDDGPPWRAVGVYPDDGASVPLAQGEIQTVEIDGRQTDVYLGLSREPFGCSEQPAVPQIEIVERWSL